MPTLRNIPWITDGANDFLEAGVKDGQIKNVLEFGSGASTYWLVNYMGKTPII